MFGYHKLSKQKSKFKKEKNKFQQENDSKEYDIDQNKVKEKAAESKSERNTARKEGYGVYDELANSDIQGLDPEKRKAMQYEANAGINRSYQNAQRKLLGDQASKGIVGKGGVAYAQQKDLHRASQEAEGGVHRDLTKLNADLKLKNLAAKFNVGQGEAAQSQMDKQLAVDELEAYNEKKKQRMFENKHNQQFTKI